MIVAARSRASSRTRASSKKSQQCRVASLIVAAGVVLAVVWPTPPTRAAAARVVRSDSQQFAWKLWGQLDGARPAENVVVSPYSVAEAFAMLRAGARGKTASQLDAVLTQRGNSVQHSQRSDLRRQLTLDRVEGSGGVTRIANSLWTAANYPIDPAFVATATQSYDAQTAQLDFAKNAEAAAAINEWISGQTDKLIVDLVPPDALSGLTRAVLVNAVYFRGKWLRPFTVAETRPGRFRVSKKTAVDAPFMSGTASVTPGKAVTEISLFYTHGYVMRIAIPASASPSSAALRSAMDALMQARPKDWGRCSNIAVRIPKWEGRTATLLMPPLQQLGVTDAFDPKLADLTGISPQAAADRLFISEALHEATIAVDEQGTVAAAATALFAEAVSAPPPNVACPKSVSVDKPFVYVIEHVETGEMLFAGRVNNPVAKP
jgi:serpin B